MNLSNTWSERDTFAMAALSGVCIHHLPETAAQKAYAFADAMLEARQPKPHDPVVDRIAQNARSVYRHKKTGGLYRLISAAAIEATEAQVIVYQGVDSGRVWVRPVAEFAERFELVEGGAS